MIVPTLPPELEEFVEQQIATGKYHSEEELVVEAVRVLHRLEVHQHEFHEAVRQGIDQLARGEFTAYDDQSDGIIPPHGVLASSSFKPAWMVAAI